MMIMTNLMCLVRLAAAVVLSPWFLLCASHYWMCTRFAVISLRPHSNRRIPANRTGNRQINEWWFELGNGMKETPIKLPCHSLVRSACCLSLNTEAVLWHQSHDCYVLNCHRHWTLHRFYRKWHLILTDRYVALHRYSFVRIGLTLDRRPLRLPAFSPTFCSNQNQSVSKISTGCSTTAAPTKKSLPVQLPFFISFLDSVNVTLLFFGIHRLNDSFFYYKPGD